MRTGKVFLVQTAEVANCHQHNDDPYNDAGSEPDDKCEYIHHYSAEKLSSTALYFPASSFFQTLK